MIGLMAAAADAVQAFLRGGSITVVPLVDVTHTAATPAGAQVRARAALMQIDGRRLVFRVEAFDDVESIGQGTPERAIVDPARLLARARVKTPQS